MYCPRPGKKRKSAKGQHRPVIHLLRIPRAFVIPTEAEGPAIAIRRFLTGGDSPTAKSFVKGHDVTPVPYNATQGVHLIGSQASPLDDLR